MPGASPIIQRMNFALFRRGLLRLDIEGGNVKNPKVAAILIGIVRRQGLRRQVLLAALKRERLEEESFSLRQQGDTKPAACGGES